MAQPSSQPPRPQLCIACTKPIAEGQAFRWPAVKNHTSRPLYWAHYHPDCVPASIRESWDHFRAIHGAQSDGE